MIDKPHDSDPWAEPSDAEPAGTHAARRSARTTIVLAAIVVPVAVAIGAYALLRNQPMGGHSTTLPARFQLDLDQQFTIPAALIGYKQQASIPIAMNDLRAIAVGPNDEIYVAGDHSIQILGLDGRAIGAIKLETEPTCLAVAADDFEEPGRLYIGSAQGVLIYGPDGTALGAWPSLDQKSILTAIAIALDEVFVADAGHRIVLRYAVDGELLGRIGAASPDRQMPGFILPSPYFDLVVGPDMFLYVVNPGARRVECYTFDGQLQGFWGRAGSAVPDFFGCCNPSHLARLPDGRFVTSEKGIPRIKVYSDVGDFETVVAGPAELGVPQSALGDARGDQAHRIFDIAVTKNGLILALDPQNRSVHVFAPKEESQSAAVKQPPNRTTKEKSGGA